MKQFLLVMIGLLMFSAQVEAKIVADKLPLLTYAEAPVTVCDAPNGKRTGTIAAGNSLVLVKVIRADGWAYGSYHVANQKKRPYRWFKMAELQGYVDFENYTDKATSDKDAYRTRTSMNLVGKISSDEDLIVVAKRGDRLKVIFKADGNYYRMGWVDKTALSKTSTEDSSGDTSLTLDDSGNAGDLTVDDTDDLDANEDLSAYEE